jgi:hypothetical protein
MITASERGPSRLERSEVFASRTSLFFSIGAFWVTAARVESSQCLLSPF